MQQTTTAQPVVWEGDFFQRHRFADFLTEYLRTQSHAPGKSELRPFSLALDAGWGRGKTFFVERWAKDLSTRAPRHPVLLFNAWAADIAADPLVAFMAAFKAKLDEEVQALDLVAATGESVKKMVKGMRRAYLPAGKVLLRGLFEKWSGAGADEFFEALKTGDTDIDQARLEELGEESFKTVGKGLDEFFQKALAEQTDLAKVVAELRSSIEMTLSTLAQQGGVALPMFVFVDELDRCRPPFAIAMLEGIKHLFGVKGVCYVVSTNLAQLAEATRAVYGPGFNGAGYLKRFFDVQCELPAPSPLKFAESLFAASSVMAAAQGRLAHGMPDGGLKDTDWGETAPAAFCWVAEEFGLDFRSQQQMFAVAEASVSALGTQDIHLLWLVILCAIRHANPPFFERLARREMDIEAAWSDLLIVTRPYRRTAYDASSPQGAEAGVTLREVAAQFYANAFKLSKAAARAPTTDFDYPKRWLQHLKKAGPRGDSELRQYFSAVRCAGFISID
ncbi:hypothetical protein HLB44_16885 [Aquincola sp. S2]|uniref:KAP NTPase domain-containing protein n=2 Tax=Pseudaquabacterium terrae TaxID=2732868 RepID=A0ABX2EJ41_9BURK|nr:hypothetical protein [Aquabacterium terrae]